MYDEKTIERAKHAVGIVDYAQRHGDVRKSGATFKVLCFFHNESTPSLSLDPKTDLYFCHGCNAAGNLIQLYQKLENVDFNEAVRQLLNGLPPAKQNGNGHGRPNLDGEQIDNAISRDAQQQLERKVDQNFQRYAKPVEIPLERWLPAHQALLGSAEAAEEFLTRGIRRETLIRFRIGLVADGQRITPHDDEFREVRDKPWVGFAYFTGDRVRLVKWRPVAMSDKKQKKFVRLAKMQDVLYTDGEPDMFEDVILVSGEIDALTLSQCGYRAASLPSGDRTKITGEMKDWLLGFRKVYLAIDNDTSGMLCLRRLLAILPHDRTALITIPAEWKDANGLYVKGCHCQDDTFRMAMDKYMRDAEKPTTVYFQSLEQAFEAYAQQLVNGKESRTFWEWPWRAATDMADIQAGELVALASSRSGQGKTSIMVQSAIFNAKYKGRRIGYYTAEMETVNELIPMITAQEVRQDRRDLEPGDVEEARQKLAGCDFYFGYDPTAQTWDDIFALLEMAVKRLGLEVVVIDHLDYIIRDPDFRKEMGLKNMAHKQLAEGLAKKYGILVFVLRQMNKPSGTGLKRKQQEDPDMYSVPGSNSGITDIHHGFILYRPRVTSLEEGKETDSFSNEAKFICDKSRHKGSGGRVVTLTFKGKWARFDRPAAVDGKEDEPPAPKPARNARLPYGQNE